MDTSFQGNRSPTHRCKVCGALWILYSDAWSLCSKECGKCCNNVLMGEQIEPLLHSDLVTWMELPSNMPKPDRAEVLADELLQSPKYWPGYAAIIRRHFDELRAEWEAERSDEPVCLIGKVDCDGNELVTVSKDALDRYKDQARYTYQRAEKAEARVKELEAERPAVVVVPREEQIKQMVTRFLGWKLPEDFHPDDGISFEPFFNVEWNAKQGKPPQRRTPTGTNLFTSTQAEAMVRYMLGDDT